MLLAVLGDYMCYGTQFWGIIIKYIVIEMREVG
jgi:hypothetical protein